VCKSCHNLEKLDLAGLGIVNDETLFLLAKNCPKLEQLNIKSCRKVNKNISCNVFSIQGGGGKFSGKGGCNYCHD
jgi:hypothetical protein